MRTFAINFGINYYQVKNFCCFCCFADVVKVRLQLHQRQLAAGEAAPGMVRTGINVVRNEGVMALWSGIGPSIARGFFFGGMLLLA